tara:strand:+ start:698 stop:946 length:249 start_codon:yes stop_codon:yes gene_type:complete
VLELLWQCSEFCFTPPKKIIYARELEGRVTLRQPYYYRKIIKCQDFGLCGRANEDIKKIKYIPVKNICIDNKIFATLSYLFF